MLDITSGALFGYSLKFDDSSCCLSLDVPANLITNAFHKNLIIIACVYAALSKIRQYCHCCSIWHSVEILHIAPAILSEI